MVYTTSATDMVREGISLIKSTERRGELEYAGLDYVRQTHSYEKIAHQLETILEEAIKEKRNGAIHERA